MVPIISRPYYAAKIYFSSYGIAWFDVDTFLKLLNFIESKKIVSTNEMDSFLKKNSQNPFAKTGKEGHYFARLLWHLGILVKSSGREYRISSYGQNLLTQMEEDTENRENVLRTIFKKWYPLIVFLRYIDHKGSASPKVISSELGGEMKHWTSILYQLGILQRGNVAKPYNKFVVSSLFIPLSVDLGLIDKGDNKIRLTKDGERLIRDYVESSDIIRTMPGDYTIYAGIADVLYDAEEPVIVSPWINGTVERLITVIGSINKELSKIILVVRNTQKNKEVIRRISKTPSFDIEPRYYQNLHSKITTNYQGPSIESSANLLVTSLKRNYEIGTYYPRTPEELALAVEELISISKPLKTF
ncbi:hypothetical protein ADU37_CDS07640 [Thermococcus sp. 2319x1]|uniref:hypothetical protein n=1 Tax=Thermococcus sp. 2319x1 TaxID=1674923 RepID=UPI00073AA3C2|nr:hypothetical protein [Thermococcus sp. 2319x1]ALV62463.1 hypothetical protein ADU37_CDS07640 [Thermococcus sp. 2319x1]